MLTVLGAGASLQKLRQECEEIRTLIPRQASSEGGTVNFPLPFETVAGPVYTDQDQRQRFSDASNTSLIEIRFN